MKTISKGIQDGTDDTVCTDHSVGDSAVGSDHCISANQHVLLHLTAVAQTDPGLSVHVMSGVSTALAFMARKVGLWRDGIDPATDHVGGDGVVHEEI